MTPTTTVRRRPFPCTRRPLDAVFASIACATATLLATGLAHGDDIRLRSSVRVSGDDGVVRLGDVAELEGEHARALADLVVADLDARAAHGRPIELRVAEIRRRLDDAGVHRGRVNLHGRLVVVRPRHAGNVAAMTTAVVGGADRTRRPRTDDDARTHADVRPLRDLVDTSTVLGAVARRMLADLHEAAAADDGPSAIATEDLRLVVAPASRDLADRDATGRTLDLLPETSWLGERVVVTVREVRGGRVERLGRLVVSPLRRAIVPLAARTIGRGDTITAADLRVETTWLPPMLAALQADPESVVGRTATRRLREGETLRAADADAPVVVERGDLVSIACHVGGLVISLDAEAREDGAVGDHVVFRRLGERTEFEAVVTGPGRAERRFRTATAIRNGSDAR